MDERSGKIDWYERFVELGARKEGRVWGPTAGGKYTDIEYDMWRLYEHPRWYVRACRALLKEAKIGKLDEETLFVGLERDGIPLAFMLAHLTGARPAFATKTTFGADMKDFRLRRNAKAYLVVDVHNAGTTYAKTCTAVERCQAEILNPVLAFVNRSGLDTACLWPHLKRHLPRHHRRVVSLVKTDEPAWDYNDWPPHLLGQRPVR